MKVDYIALSIPVFFILIAAEVAYAVYKKLDYYRLNDSLSNLSQGIGSQLLGIFLKAITFFCYLYIYEHLRFYSFSNPKYIDKNHAGTLIIWDRMFGTFQKEEEVVVYGITKPLASWNPVWANFHYWADLLETAKRTKGLKDRINVFIKPPGWFPEHLGGMQPLQEIDISVYTKYSPAYNPQLNLYILFQFLFSLGLASLLLFLSSKFTTLQLTACTFLVILTLTSCGALLEQKNWIRRFEYVRIFFWIIIPFLFTGQTFFTNLFIGNALAAVLSFIWFNRIQQN